MKPADLNQHCFSSKNEKIISKIPYCVIIRACVIIKLISVFWVNGFQQNVFQQNLTLTGSYLISISMICNCMAILPTCTKNLFSHQICCGKYIIYFYSFFYCKRWLIHVEHSQESHYYNTRIMWVFHGVPIF